MRVTFFADFFVEDAVAFATVAFFAVAALGAAFFTAAPAEHPFPVEQAFFFALLLASGDFVTFVVFFILYYLTVFCFARDIRHGQLQKVIEYSECVKFKKKQSLRRVPAFFSCVPENRK